MIFNFLVPLSSKNTEGALVLEVLCNFAIDINANFSVF